LDATQNHFAAVATVLAVGYDLIQELDIETQSHFGYLLNWFVVW